MGKKKPTFLWIQGKPHVELDLTTEAANLIHHLTVNPGVYWKKEDWHPASKENADRIAGEEISKIAKWIEERVFGKIALRVGPEARALAMATIERLKKAYEDGDGPVKEGGVDIPREQYRQIAWGSVQAVFERPYTRRKVLLGKRLAARLQDLLKHYRGKMTQGTASLTTNFSDLEAALEGKPIPSAEDAEKDD